MLKSAHQKHSWSVRARAASSSPLLSAKLSSSSFLRCAQVLPARVNHVLSYRIMLKPLAGVDESKVHYRSYIFFPFKGRTAYGEPVLWNRDILLRMRILGSVLLSNGSGCGSGGPKHTVHADPDPDANPEHW